jgi:tryptophanase
MAGNIPSFLLSDRDSNYQSPLYASKVVTRLETLPKKERIRRIKRVGYNVFALDADGIAIDLLTDSGTGSISDKQLSAMMIGDESYAGASSFFKLRDTISDLFGIDNVVPTHQGRGAEKILNAILTLPAFRAEQSRYIKQLLSNNDLTEKQIESLIDGRDDFVPEVYITGNTHFDTTAEHIQYAHGRPVDLTIKQGRRSDTIHPFKGNIDTRKLETFLADIVKRFGKRNIRNHVPYVIITITCNSGGGQPVSLKNIEKVSQICKKYNILLFFDAARYAENAYFIKERERGNKSKTIKQIIREMFSHVDGCTMSAKKDGIVPMGGFIAVRDKQLYEDLANINILFEGYKTYGGMSGLMMEALSQGLNEGANYEYLKDRIGLVKYLGEGIRSKNIPIVEPIGGHAVFVDARKFYKGIIPEDQFPAQALTAFLYIESGVRAVEIGSCLKGRDPITGENKKADMDLMRLTIPRRRYNKEHMDVVINALDFLYKNRRQAKGLKIIRGSEPRVGIRHFTVKFQIVG